MEGLLLAVADAIKKARDGVDYDVRDGAACPYCGHRTKVHRALRFDGDLRLRYHRCNNPECVLAVVEENIRSWQIRR